MRIFGGVWLFCSLWAGAVFAQMPQIHPQVITKADFPRSVMTVELAARFVTTIRLPEVVNSIVLGDPSRFQVEHSEREPKLVFVKAISAKPAETNLLVSTITGREVSFLLISRGESAATEEVRVDFVVNCRDSGDFLVAPSGFPSALAGQTLPLAATDQPPENAPPAFERSKGPNRMPDAGLDRLLEQQEAAPLPALYGERVAAESAERNSVRAGVGRVIDGGDQVIILFSVINPTKHAILLMPPQVQLAGVTVTGKLIRRRKSVAAEQLPVLDYRLSRQRLGSGERADGVALFERPPYKQSNEMLLLQVAESGAVDRPALAPIGFGVSSSEEVWSGRGK